MKKPGATLLPMTLDRASSQSLHEQIFTGIQSGILEGRLAPGTRLPSSRLLAKDLSVSRNTVLGAFDMLAAEGYTEARSGSSTRVSSILPETLQTPSVSGLVSNESTTSLPLSKLARSLVPRRSRHLEKIVPFNTGAPDLSAFPFDIWNRLIARFWRRPPDDVLINGDPAGYQPLRQAIAEYLQTFRSVNCNADQVIITTGAQQALTLAARVLLNPGDRVWVENPGYIGLQQAITASGAIAIPVQIDEEGVDARKWELLEPSARVAAVTPSHHYPTGVTMSLPRRLSLLDWASKQNSWIIEDDYDSEFRYAGRPLSALQGLDRQGRVIYAGTFSKVIFPALRIGYLVVPPGVVNTFISMRRTIDDQPSIGVQPALAAFMAEGHFASHVRRMRTLYAGRREVLINALQQHLGDRLRPAPSEAGVHLCCDFETNYGETVNDKAVAIHARKNGINVVALSDFYLTEPKRQGLILGYAAFDSKQLDKAVLQLAEILNSFDHPGP